MVFKVISRKEAKFAGLVRYFSGKECPNGHKSERFVSTWGCVECGNDRRISETGKRHGRETRARWRAKNPEESRAQSKKQRAAIKLEVLTHYSVGPIPRCACCGETEIIFLTVDHKKGDGANHIRSLFGPRQTDGRPHSSGGRFYRWLRRNGYPKGFQVLCFNCNFAKHVLGCCPHKKGKR